MYSIIRLFSFMKYIFLNNSYVCDNLIFLKNNFIKNIYLYTNVRLCQIIYNLTAFLYLGYSIGFTTIYASPYFHIRDWIRKDNYIIQLSLFR